MAQRTHVPIWLIPLNLTLVIIVGLLVARTWFWERDLPEDQMLALRLVHRQIAEEHVEPPETSDLLWAAIEGMVRSTDQHSRFIRPSNVGAFEEDTTGAYVGIGVKMALDIDPVTVEYPFPGGPSEAAGLQVGDQILAVDGVPLEAGEDEPLLEIARNRLLGPDQSRVRVNIKRGDAAPFETIITRGAVQTASVRWARLADVEQGIGYIYLRSFQHNSSNEVAAALRHLQSEAAATGGLRALIFDLRFNRGGLLEQAVAVTNLFLREGTIVSLKRRDAEIERHIASPADSLAPELPLVLLVDEESASASEVFAGALQDHNRAVLVGTRTFGKGLVQSIYRWEDLNFRLKLTTAHYYTPKGRSIERTNRRPEDGASPGGLEPNEVVEIEETARTSIRNILEHRSEPPRQYRDQVRVLATQLKLEQPTPLGPDEDLQLAAALAAASRRASQASETPAATPESPVPTSGTRAAAGGGKNGR